MSSVPPESELALAVSGAALSGLAFAVLAVFSGGVAPVPLSAGFEASAGADVLANGVFPVGVEAPGFVFALPGVAFAAAGACASGVIDGAVDCALCEAAGVDIGAVVAAPGERFSVLPGACSVIAGFLAEGFSHANPCCFHRKYPNPTANASAIRIKTNFHSPEPPP